MPLAVAMCVAALHVSCQPACAAHYKNVMEKQLDMHCAGSDDAHRTAGMMFAEPGEPMKTMKTAVTAIENALVWAHGRAPTRAPLSLCAALHELEAQRDDLLAALYAIIEKTTNTYASDEGRLCNALTDYLAHIARAAIAKVEE